MNIIKCQQCGTEIEIDKALESQIESRILTQINEQHRQELLKIKSEAEISAKALMDEQIKLQVEQNKQQQALLIERLTTQAAETNKTNSELRSETIRLTQVVLSEQKARENAEFEANKKLLEETAKIREETRRQADEAHRFKEMELQKQLSDTKKALDDAQRKAEQGSTQIQGEVLEIELESILKHTFPTDTIDEIKKGQRGADVKQTVKNVHLEDCGILLWESKNASTWQNDWIPKLKEDMVAANASVGIIVSSKMPEHYRDMCNIESNVWVVKPNLSIALAAALRGAVLQVYAATRFTVSKDEKMERMYQYLIGAEFSNRIRAIVDNYRLLQTELEKERRAATLRWGRQEKAIRSVIDNTFGFYGDIQGLTGNELQEVLLIENESEEEKEE